MKVTSHIVEVDKYEGVGDKMGDMLPLEPGAVWLVATSPIHDDRPTEFSIVDSDDGVFIPVHQYLTDNNASAATAYAMSLGFKAMIDASIRHGGRMNPVRLHIARGDAVKAVKYPQPNGANDGYMMYFGLAIQVA